MRISKFIRLKKKKKKKKLKFSEALINIKVLKESRQTLKV